jgi:hypothetical protein
LAAPLQLAPPAQRHRRRRADLQTSSVKKEPLDAPHLAQDINRGLDNATKLAQADETVKLQAAYQRLVLKATTLVEGSDGKGGLSLGAFALINGKLNYSRLRR